MFLDILKSGENRKYELSIDTLYMLAPKWPSINGKMTPFVLSKSKYNPLSEATQNFQFQKNNCTEFSINFKFDKSVNSLYFAKTFLKVYQTPE